jgi:hypothetical protein
MSAKRPAESLSNAEQSKGRVHGGKGSAQARLNGGNMGGPSAPPKPISESSIAKRMHSRGLSVASGVDSKDDEEDHSKVWV